MDDEHDDEMSYEEMTQESTMNVDALTALLIEKKVITQKELDKKIDELYPDDKKSD